MKKSIVSMLFVTLFLSPLAQARRNNNREARQEARINQGIKSGELTAHEAKKLERGQERIDEAQDKAMADGKMTAKEKLKLEKMQDRQSRKIYRQKHDAQDRDRNAHAATPANPGQPGDGAEPAVPAAEQ